jgi:hypothetical protein
LEDEPNVFRLISVRNRPEAGILHHNFQRLAHMHPIRLKRVVFPELLGLSPDLLTSMDRVI